MRGINKVILVGTLGADPETRYNAGGGAVTTISMATSKSWKDKTTGDQVEKTEWHRVTFFNRLAEVAGEYLKKGRQVYIEAELSTRKYMDREGIERYATDIIAYEMQMLGGNLEGRERGQAPARSPAPAPAPAQQQRGSHFAGQAVRSPANVPPPSSDFNDDIPF